MKIFIGGAWPYANNSLHIGHLAALLPGDIIARYYRMNGDEVIYVSGTDSHGTPITERARKEGIKPEIIAHKYHDEFAQNFKDLNFSYDLYTATFEDYHKEHVQTYFKEIMDNGYIYEKTEEQDYCDKCGQYLSDREIEGICPECGALAKGDQCDSCLTTVNAKQLKDRKCRQCGTPTVMRENTHLYLALSKFQEPLQEYIDKHKDEWRTNAVNESMKYLKMGLIDRAATRQLEWGVDTLVPGFEDKKIYVWIEAVLGYLTAGRRYAESQNINFDDFIKDSSELRSYYVHGKDNIPFHTIIFPALIMAIGEDIQLPEYIISSEYVNMNNEKMSKSKGNLITLNELAKNYNADTIRYYMTVNAPERRDVNFSSEELELSHNKHLVGEYGNFINRNLSFLVKKFDGIVPEGDMDPQIQSNIDELYKKVGSLIENGDLKNAIDLISGFIQSANKYYDDQKPWVQVKEDIKAFNNTTYTCINMMANIANLLEPFMPESSARAKAMLGINSNKWEPVIVEKNIKLNNVEILFERIEIEKK